MRFCLDCGLEMGWGQPPGENRPRHHCRACGFIHYENPKIVLGTLPIQGDKVALIRRGIEPRAGYWAYPGGFMELGESTQEGARRETMEETQLEVEVGPLLNIYSRPHAHVVTIIYLARIVGGKLEPGPESLEVALFGPDEIPWGQLAFPTVVEALRDWLALTRAIER